MGYSNKIANWYLREDRKYVYQSISIAKIWGIQNKITAVKNIAQIHGSVRFWTRIAPIILLPDALYKPIYFLRKAVSAKTKPLERRLKNFIKKV